MSNEKKIPTLYRGKRETMPQNGKTAEPRFTTDTHELFINDGDGKNVLVGSPNSVKFKFNYDTNIQYDKFDLVNYEGTLYLSIIEENRGNNPRAPLSTAWIIFVDLNLTELDLKADDADVVKISGDQTVAGVKTFSSPLVVPNGTENNHAINKSQLDTKVSTTTFDMQMLEKQNIKPNGTNNLIDASGKIDPLYIDNLFITDIFEVDTLAEMLELTNVQKGDMVIVAENSSSYILKDLPVDDIDSWAKLLVQPSVVSVNGKTGVVSLATGDIEGLNEALETKADMDVYQEQIDTINEMFDSKIDKVTGKGLSTNDYTNADKAKVDKLNIAGSATTYLNGAGEYTTPPNTTYSTMSLVEGQAASATTGRIITSNILKDIILHHSPAGARPASDVSAWAKAEVKPTYTASEVGLGNVNNTTDSDKPISTATQTALDLKADDTDVVKLSGNQTISGVKTFSSTPIVPNGTANNHTVNKGQFDEGLELLETTINNNINTKDAQNVKLTGAQTVAGVKTFSSPVVVPNGTENNHAINKSQLDTKVSTTTFDMQMLEKQNIKPNGSDLLISGGKINSIYIDNLSVMNKHEVDTIDDMLALTDVNKGDMVIVAENSSSYILKNLPASNIDNWAKLLNQPSVVSVNGKIGVVVIDINDISGLDGALNSKLSIVTYEDDKLLIESSIDDRVKTSDFDVYKDSVTTSLDTKVDKVVGKELSKNDYTDVDKAKVDKLDITGSATTYLNAAGGYTTPPNTTYGAMSLAEGQAATVTTGRVIASDVLKSVVLHHSPAGARPASDVSAWAKAAAKPSYTASEVGLGNVNNTNDLNKPISTATQAALDLKADDIDVVKLTGNQTIAGTKTFSSSVVVPNGTTATHAVNKSQLDTKVDKVNGKGLSANDYTTTEKNKLAGIEAGAQVNRPIATTEQAQLGTDNTTVMTPLGVKTNYHNKDEIDILIDNLEIDGGFL